MRTPVVGSSVVLVVAGDEVRAVRCAQPRERGDVVLELVDSAVDEVSGDDDDVGRVRVHSGDDVFDEAPVDRRTHVQVGKLYEPQPVERRWELPQGDLDAVAAPRFGLHRRSESICRFHRARLH